MIFITLKMSRLKFKFKYFIVFVIIFIIEVFIALYLHDSFIRPYFGDFLVVIMIYSFVMSFINFSKYKVALFVLLFAYCIEFAQCFNLLLLLGLENMSFAKVVLGNSFATEDLALYTLGFGGIVLVEFLIERNKTSFH